MNGQTYHDSFSYRLYNQGQILPSTDVAGAQLPNSDCPYHASVLQVAQGVVSEGVHPLQKFTNAPLSALPVGLSAKYRVGTSASDGCICRHNTGIPRDAMAHELDSMTPNKVPTKQ